MKIKNVKNKIPFIFGIGCVLIVISMVIEFLPAGYLGFLLMSLGTFFMLLIGD